ncbi:zinc-binding alcohol dehydrogenase [Streptomyces sp. NPDC059101]|uniref:zinc-dependent alcohol dehydrogenase n=1 Tax=Streptomyces sp. NPDC059101 TaxID=3346728 RepID=UPI0036C29B86
MRPSAFTTHRRTVQEDSLPRVAQSFWLSAPGRGEIRTVELPRPAAGEVLVRTLYSGVSRGTESLVFRGGVPESQYAVMRAPFQDGGFPAPVKYGYLNVGVVEEGPPALRGRTVFCLYPHQTHYVVPADAVTPVPDAVPAARAVLAGTVETAVNGVWDAAPPLGVPVGVVGGGMVGGAGAAAGAPPPGPAPRGAPPRAAAPPPPRARGAAPAAPLLGDRIAVVGGGMVGSAVAALLARYPAARVQLVDADPARAATAAALGVPFALPADARGDCDLVVHASATEEGLGRALELLAPEGTVIELSWYGDRRVGLPLGESFHSRRLTVRSSQVGALAPAQRGRRTFADRMALALDLLADPAFGALITGESPFEDLPSVLPRLASGALPALCHRIRYPAAGAPASGAV